jgi:hypothetical protein
MGTSKKLFGAKIPDEPSDDEFDIIVCDVIHDLQRWFDDDQNLRRDLRCEVMTSLIGLYAAEIAMSLSQPIDRWRDRYASKVKSCADNYYHDHYQMPDSDDHLAVAVANGIKPSTFRSRIANGWERAISTPTRTYTQRRRGHMACPPRKIDELLTSIQRILDTPDPDPCDGLLRDAIRLSLLVTDDMFEDDHTLDYLETLSDCWDGFIDRYLESVEGKELDARGVAKRILENIHDAIKPAEKAEHGK